MSSCPPADMCFRHGANAFFCPVWKIQLPLQPGGNRLCDKVGTMAHARYKLDFEYAFTRTSQLGRPTLDILEKLLLVSMLWDAHGCVFQAVINQRRSPRGMERIDRGGTVAEKRQRLVG